MKSLRQIWPLAHAVFSKDLQDKPGPNFNKKGPNFQTKNQCFEKGPTSPLKQKVFLKVLQVWPGPNLLKKARIVKQRPKLKTKMDHRPHLKQNVFTCL